MNKKINSEDTKNSHTVKCINLKYTISSQIDFDSIINQRIKLKI